MTNQPGNTITNRIIVDTASAIQQYQQIRAEIDATKKDLLAMQQAAGGGAFKDLGKGLEAQLKASAGSTQQIKAQVSAITPAIKELNSEADKGTPTWQRFGRAIQIALGITLYQVIRSIINGIKELISTAIDYGRVLANLAVSTRALQKLGSDITFKEVIQQVKDLKAQFPIVSTKDAADAVAYTQLLLRNFGATQEQMKKVTEIGAGLSIMLGKDLKTSVRELALFFSSGYAESLQRAGFAVNRLAVIEQAHRDGIQKSYMQLTEQERFQESYILVLDQYKNIQGDINGLMGQSYVRVQQVQASWQDLVNTLSLQFLPSIGNIAAAIDGLIGILKVLGVYAGSGMTLISKLIEMATTGKIFDIRRQTKDWTDWITQWRQGISDALSGTADLSKMPFGNAQMGDLAKQLGLDQDTLQKLGDIADKIYQHMTMAQLQFERDSERLETEYQRNRDEIILNGIREAEQLWQDHLDKMLDIQTKATQDYQDAEIKYQQDVADAEIQYQSQVASASEKYHDDELKAERDFQEKMLELRERFMLDLEDAVQARDARQILRLIRNYNLQKEQETRQYKLDEQARRDAYERELADLARARDEKLAALALELERRKAMIDLEERRELEAEAKNYDDKKAQMDEKLDQQKEDLKTRLKQQTDDLIKNFTDANQQFVDNIALTEGDFSKYIDYIIADFQAAYGDDGQVIGYIKNAIAWLDALKAAMNIGTVTGSSGPSTNEPQYPGHAGGASFIANSPQIHKFGEIPELVNITPLNQINSTYPGGKGGRISIALILSPDLEARVENNTLGKMADIILERAR